MIDSKVIADIIAVYHKYGWILRRVLLTTELKKRLGTDTSQLFAGIKVIDADIDAAWFSRPPQAGGIAWEIRHFSDTPYALLENIDETALGFEDALRAVESRLEKAVAKTRSA